MEELDRDTFIALRSVLANIYPTQEEGRQVAKDAGLNHIEIAFNNKPVLNWEAILEYSEITGQTFDVIDVALKKSPKHPLLNEIKENRRVLPTPAPEFEKGLDWKGPRQEENPDAFDNLEKLMENESTLLPISFLEIGLKQSKSVAKVSFFPAGGSGSGFLTEGNIFVTNHHVIRNEEQAQRAQILFNYQNNADGLDLEPIKFTLSPENGRE